MEIALLAGAIAAVLDEFGMINLINRIITLIIRSLYNLPGVPHWEVLAYF